MDTMVAQKHHPKPCPDSTLKSKTVKSSDPLNEWSVERSDAPDGPF
jgi:hypothetical protein